MNRLASTPVILVGLVALAQACGAGTNGAGPASAPATLTAPDPANRVERARLRVEVGTHAVLQVPVTSFGAAALGDDVYALGGYHGVPHQYSRDGQSRDLTRIRMAGEPTVVSRLEHGLQSVALVAHSGRLIRVGGLRATNRHGDPAVLTSVADVAAYDPNTGRWTDLPALPEPRSSHMAAVLGDSLYVAGGWRLDGQPARAEWAATLAVLDLSDPDARWEELPAPMRVRGLALAAVGTRVFALGGMEPGGTFSSQVHIFDVAERAWSEGPSFPGTAFGMAAAAMGERLVASGVDGVVYIWDPREGAAWQAEGHMLAPRFFHQLVATNDRVVAIGGTEGMSPQDRIPHIEQVYPRPASTLLEIEYPGEAVNRQGMLIIDDWLYVFGGNNSHGQHDFAPDNFVASASRFHIPTLRWEALPDYPAGRQTMSTVALGATQILSVGGFGIREGTSEAVTHPEGYVYDIEAGRWSPAAGLAQGRSQFEVARDESGSVWVIGGLNYDPRREGMAAFEHLRTIERLAPGVAGFVNTNIVLPGPRRAFGGAMNGSRFYMFGGMRDGFQLVEGCQSLDLSTGIAADVTCPNTQRLSPQLVSLDGALVLVGGSVVSEAQEVSGERAIEVYSPERDAWSPARATLPFNAQHIRAFAYHDRVLVVTTHDAPEGRMRLFFFDP